MVGAVQEMPPLLMDDPTTVPAVDTTYAPLPPEVLDQVENGRVVENQLMPLSE
jgi:hypothetical protein